MTPPPLMEASAPILTSQLRRGRTLLLAIFVILLLVNLVAAGLVVVRRDFDHLWGQFGRIGCTLLLFYLIWIGQRWARWFVVVLFFLGAVMYARPISVQPHPLLFAMTGYFLVAGAVLAFSKSITLFLSFQKENKR